MPQTTYPPTTRTLEVWHPWQFPFPGSTDYRVNDVLASGGAGITKGPTWSFQLPSTCRGIIREVFWAVANLTTASVISWTLRINQQPIPGWQNLTVFPGIVPRVTVSDDSMIPVPFGATVDIIFTNTDGAVYPQVGAGFSGHYWDQAAEDAWIGDHGAMA